MKAEIEIYYPYEDCLAVKVNGKEYGGFSTPAQGVLFATQRIAEMVLAEFPHIAAAPKAKRQDISP